MRRGEPSRGATYAAGGARSRSMSPRSFLAKGPLDSAPATLGGFTWSAVFHRVEQAWRDAIGRTTCPIRPEAASGPTLAGSGTTRSRGGARARTSP